MKQYKYGVIGSFVLGRATYGGQSIKTRNFADALEEYLGEGTVLRVDTASWKKKPFRLVAGILRSLSECEETVILPADRGVFVIPYLVVFLRGLRKIKLRYVVIGGWLPEFVQKHKGLARCLKKFSGIYVETKTMKNALERLSFANVVVLPNFKRIQVLAQEQLVYAQGTPYKLCTFSRVLKEKGIEDAANAVKQVNEQLGKVVFALDIYGRVDPSYEEAFAAVTKDFPEYIRYKGAADGSKSTEIIKDYYALLFPTRYYTEGIPGTIIDAYCSGVPVISARWESFSDIVDDGRTGIGYAFCDTDALVNVLLELAEDPQKLNDMKAYCLQKAKEYMPEVAIKGFASRGD